MRPGEQFAHESNLLLQQLGSEEGDARNISSWTTDVADEAQFYRIAADAEDDRDCRSRCPGGRCRRTTKGCNDGNTVGRQLFREREQPVVPVSRANIERHVSADDIADLSQP